MDDHEIVSAFAELLSHDDLRPKTDEEIETEIEGFGLCVDDIVNEARMLRNVLWRANMLSALAINNDQLDNLLAHYSMEAIEDFAMGVSMDSLDNFGHIVNLMKSDKE